MLESYFAPSRRFKLAGRMVGAKVMAEILRGIEAEVVGGVMTRDATRKVGIAYQSYLRFRTHPLLRGYCKRMSRTVAVYRAGQIPEPIAFRRRAGRLRALAGLRGEGAVLERLQGVGWWACTGSNCGPL